MAERLNTILRHIGTSSQALVEPSLTSYSVPYEYTVDQTSRGRLTEQQREFYEENGFLVIKNLVPKSEIAKYRKRFEEICTGEVQMPGLTIMRDVAIAKSEFVKDQKAVTKIQPLQRDEVFWEYCRLPQIVDYVECFLGPNVLAMHAMLINKPPDPGKLSSRHPMHQDLYFFPFRPANRIVCAWTAMEKINRDNGGLVVIPGSHKGTLLAHDYPKWEGGVNKLYHGVKDYNPDTPRFHLEMEEGDTVFFHPVLIHGSGANRTQGFRKAISCHYSTGHCTWIDLKGSVQEKIERELLEINPSLLGMPKEMINYQNFWKFRSRVVRGDTSFTDEYI